MTKTIAIVAKRYRPAAAASRSAVAPEPTTIAVAAGRDSVPAASGRYGLLMRSMSTSVSWFTPTM